MDSERQPAKPRKRPQRMSPEEFDDLDLDAQFDACLDGTAPTDAEYFKAAKETR